MNTSHKMLASMWACVAHWTFVSINCHIFLIWLDDHRNHFVCAIVCFSPFCPFVCCLLFRVREIPFCSSRPDKSCFSMHSINIGAMEHTKANEMSERNIFICVVFLQRNEGKNSCKHVCILCTEQKKLCAVVQSVNSILKKCWFFARRYLDLT